LTGSFLAPKPVPYRCGLVCPPSGAQYLRPEVHGKASGAASPNSSPSRSVPRFVVRPIAVLYVAKMQQVNAATAVAILSMIVSLVTAWLTLLRRGTVKMVRPQLVAFLDARGSDGPKVWFRALLHNTAPKGNVLESMFVRLHRGETRQNFSFWVCGDDKLSSGCGLYIGQTGIALNHHFMQPKDGSKFEFVPGEYVIEVFGRLVGATAPFVLGTMKLQLTEAQAKALKNADENVYFDWWPDSQRYNAHVVRKPELPELPPFLSEMFGGKSQKKSANQES
jgi:hypothetical protein